MPLRCTDAADVALGALGDWLTRTTGVHDWRCNPSAGKDKQYDNILWNIYASKNVVCQPKGLLCLLLAMCLLKVSECALNKTTNMVWAL